VNPAAGAAIQLDVAFGRDVQVLVADTSTETRGRLTAVDFDQLSFPVQRVFTVTDVPAGTCRGGHAHTRGAQALFCLAGRIDVELRRGDTCLEVALLPDGVGLRINAGVWSSQRYLMDGSELLVLASDPYDPSSYDAAP
jgi:hypothetical protein